MEINDTKKKQLGKSKTVRRGKPIASDDKE